MKHAVADRQRVYRTCRAIFSGNNAQVRQTKAIRKLLKNNQTSLQPLFQDLGKARLLEILHDLLESRIFESDLRAKVEFPDLFRSSPHRDAQREASEADAVRSAAVLLRESTLSEGGDELAEYEAAQPEPATSSFENLEAAAETSASLSIPSLYPSYLPYKAQHLILTTAQRVLEECCFDFASRWLPDVIQKKGWECAAAIELTQWAKILDKSYPQLSSDALDITGSSLREAFISVRKLRHTAVHRLPTTARGISQLVASALSLTEVLRDHTRAAQLEELKSEVDGKIKAMELNKNVLEDRTISRLEEISRQREELDRLEREFIEHMRKEDCDNKGLIGGLLEASVERIFTERAVVTERPKTTCLYNEDEVELDRSDGHDSETADTVRNSDLGGDQAFC